MFDTDFLMALLTIIAIDLVLAGDNAVVIAMASRNLPEKLRNKAIYWGTAGAIIVRVLMTLVAVWLMRVPYLQALGGMLLIPVALKLLKHEDTHESVTAADNFWTAIKTIIVADAIMGIDNVLAIAGASHGNMLLVVLGLLISVPIVIRGSQWISGWMNKYPALVYVGAGILAWTAGGMIMHDKVVGSYLTSLTQAAGWLVPLVIVILVVAVGKLWEAKQTNSQGPIH
ncbi:TerC family protein [Acetonema longum]|uniref:Integral membrane protein, terc family n=1 Tax=Acetonema longum DSM 6540 TaxID=1009370 RepID=F7NQG3_9FIRM|nr:TerC family protein [Acetonema longum]EGO61741.1 integral membrane protein, terc family [Acetonema longum DSM 6540]